MSAKTSIRYDWLQLIEVSGPFLSTTVLSEAFPDGLDGFDKRVKRDLSRFYSEWVEAVELKLIELPELHRAWIQSVLREGLEFQDGDLSDGADWSVAGEGGLGHFSPDWGLKGLDGKPVLFIKALPADVKPEDRDTSDEWKDTVIEKMTRLCRAYKVRLGLVTNGEKWILVNAAPGGTLSGAATWYARLWFQEDTTLRAFLALVGYRRFVGAPKKRLPYLLDESLKHLEEVTDTLGKQVMTAVEVLMEGFDRADLDSGRLLLAGVSPTQLYEAALTVMMRLVFLLCAEERGLMLLGEKKYDDVYAVSTLRRKLEEEKDKFGAEVLERRYDAWARLLSVFRLVYSGVCHPDLQFPAMGGSLFNPDKYPFLEGRQLCLNAADDNPPPLPIDNRTVLLILESLQVLKHRDGAIPLSFRSLDVEQIGYIYEGLLEFTGARATEIMLGLKGDKAHQNPEVSLAELESLRLDSEKKLIDYIIEQTGRSGIAKEYAAEPDSTYLPYLSKICRGNKKLEERILPFINWLRTSEWGEPVVYHKDSFFVTNGQDRRSSGTHYTPKTLTEMDVREALEPIVYIGPALGWPRSKWQLRTPAEILALKVCDVAMGSGAFLVQVCRYLADRLLEAWAIAEKEGKAISSDGRVTDFPPSDPMSKVQEDRLCEARRLVAEKCLYGVDINPLAVELAKLSLWLVTTSKGRPFSFLDHNLKSGDSLLGVSDVEQLVQFRMKPDPKFPGSLLSATIRQTVADVLKEREEIRSLRTRDITDIQLAEAKNIRVNNALVNIRAYADYFISEVLVAGKPTKKTAARLDAAALEGESLLTGDTLQTVIFKKKTAANLAYDLPAGQTAPRRPFHWAIEFPEVFAQGGFNAIVGNPPFRGGRMIGNDFGMAYCDYLSFIRNGVKGSPDLCVYFLLRAFSLLNGEGRLGLLATKAISETGSREVGLNQLVNLGGTLYSAYSRILWPGTADVVISIVFVSRSPWNGVLRLNGEPVDFIDSSLTSEIGAVDGQIRKLSLMKGCCSQGFDIMGDGFILSEQEKKDIESRDKKSARVIFPLFNGQDLNSLPELLPSRWIINFGDMNHEDAKQFEAAYARVFKLVKPYREGLTGQIHQKSFWKYWDLRSKLAEQMSQHDKILATATNTKYISFQFVPTVNIYNKATKLLYFYKCSEFAILQSSLHQEWAIWRGGTLGLSTYKYSTSDVLETWPMPARASDNLQDLGFLFHDLRQRVMVSAQLGLTPFYNKFHDPNVEAGRFEELRALQVKIDNAVRDAYGWTDLDLGHGFHEVGYLPENDNIRFTISEPARIEVLKRLAKLNKERWEEEEAAGLHKKGKALASR